MLMIIKNIKSAINQIYIHLLKNIWKNYNQIKVKKLMLFKSYKVNLKGKVKIKINNLLLLKKL